MITSHIRVLTLYYENGDLLSKNRVQIYDKDKHEQVTVIVLYKSEMGLITFLFDTTDPKIGNS